MSFSEQGDNSPSSSLEEERVGGSQLLPRPPLEPDSPDTSFEHGSTQHPMEKHPKGKRKRTAAKDKSILEAAYNANPKPDKAARLDLVQRVSLNEKEVQIWFQNRRQNDRRKSRPLSPQEIAALRSGGMHVLSSDPITSSSQAGDRTSPAAEPAQDSTTNQDDVQVLCSGHEDASVSDPQSLRIAGNVSGEDENSTSETPTASTRLESHFDSSGLSSSFSSSIGYLSNRWNLSGSFSTPSSANRPLDAQRNTSFLSSSPPSASSCSVLPPPQSGVRLSLSLEGKAELVSNEKSPQTQPAALPSPLPRLAQDRPRPFQRSQSAAANITLPPISALTESLPPSLRRGRSRDAQAWVQCCDSDSRDELTAQAENESNGSAVAAISLLRSTSNVLHPNSAKRNAPPSCDKSQQGKKPRLSRTLSSNAVMQKTKEYAPPFSPDTKPGKISTILQSPSGDSDKENWSPEGGRTVRNGPSTGANRRPFGPGSPRTGNPRRQGRLLRDQTAPWLAAGSRASTMPVGGRRGVLDKDLEIFEDAENRPPQRRGDEVEKFMRGEVSPSKKGDMDCIAGLLSLSQGNWR